MSKAPDDYALVVGINHYTSSELAPLARALDDAIEIKKWLLDQNDGGGLPPENCQTILSQQNSGKPVHAEIDEAIANIMELAQKRQTPARRLYFYFSGHGMAASHVQAFLCLPKWSSLWRKMSIDSQDYWLMLADCGLFREIVCLFDCCRSYKPNVGGLGSALGTARPNAQAAGARLFLGFAAEYTNAAFEEPGIDGHGFFTRALLSGLRGGACQPTGGAPAQRLKGFLESETEELAKQAGKRQRPTVFNGFPAAAEPVFGSAFPLNGVGANKLVYKISVSDAPGRSVVLVRPDATETPWNGSDPWQIETGEGLHILRDKTDGKTMMLPRDSTQGEIHVEF